MNFACLAVRKVLVLVISVFLGLSYYFFILFYFFLILIKLDSSSWARVLASWS